MLDFLIAIAGVAISSIGSVKYVQSVLKNDGVYPNLASWLAWLMANIVFAIVAFSSESMAAFVFCSIAASLNLLVLIAALVKDKIRRVNKKDVGCLIVAILSIVALVFIEDKTISAIVAIGANLSASWPTMKKCYFHPKTEASALFFANTIAGALGCIGVGAFNLALAGPGVMMVGNLIMFSLAFFRIREKIKYIIRSYT